MKRLLAIIILFLVFLFNCTWKQGEPYFCHLYGYMKDVEDSIGVNNIFLYIKDLDPNNADKRRIRETKTAMSSDSMPGFFEMDSVCYGTTTREGNFVEIYVDSIKNPGWATQLWVPIIHSEVETLILYLYK